MKQMTFDRRKEVAHTKIALHVCGKANIFICSHIWFNIVVELVKWNSHCEALNAQRDRSARLVFVAFYRHRSRAVAVVVLRHCCCDSATILVVYT